MAVSRGRRIKRIENRRIPRWEGEKVAGQTRANQPQWCKRVQGKSPDSREPATFNVFFAKRPRDFRVGCLDCRTNLQRTLCKWQATDRGIVSSECCYGLFMMMMIPWLLHKPYLKRFEVAPRQREVSGARFQLMSGLTRSEHALIPDEASQIKPANLTAWLMQIQIQMEIEMEMQMQMLPAHF